MDISHKAKRSVELHTTASIRLWACWDGLTMSQKITSISKWAIIVLFAIYIDISVYNKSRSHCYEKNSRIWSLIYNVDKFLTLTLIVMLDTGLYWYLI